MTDQFHSQKEYERAKSRLAFRDGIIIAAKVWFFIGIISSPAYFLEVIK